MDVRPRTIPSPDDLDALAAAVVAADGPEAAFAAVDAAAARLIGHRLFTIMAFDAAAMRVRRLYSSRPDAYPAGGCKDKRDTAWGRQVLEQGRPFVGRHAADIRANFDDHEVLLGLGLGSVLNLAVRHAGRTLGTMNLLHRAGYYDADDVATGRLLAEQLAGPLGAPRS